MKIITIISLAIVLMFCSMGKTGMIISYHINKTYIVKEFCENKAKPQMQCNGKCHLKKQLTTEETQKDNTPVSTEKLPDVFWATANETATANQTVVSSKIFLVFLIPAISKFPTSVFHPPSVV